MPIDRFYVNAPLKGKVIVEGAEFHHAVRVVRAQVGEAVELMNGQGNLATATIVHIDKTMILEVQNVKTQPRVLHQMFSVIPLMRPSKLEWVIEKGTELGADGFVLYPADYSEKERLSSHQLERLHAIALAATKQSGRLYLPSLEILAHLSEVFQKEGFFFFGDSLETGMVQYIETSRTFFVTGPEKGFSEKEKTLLREKAQPACLNPHILRAETAPLAALALFFGTSRKK